MVPNLPFLCLLTAVWKSKRRKRTNVAFREKIFKLFFLTHSMFICPETELPGAGERGEREREKERKRRKKIKRKRIIHRGIQMGARKFTRIFHKGSGIQTLRSSSATLVCVTGFPSWQYWPLGFLTLGDHSLSHWLLFDKRQARTPGLGERAWVWAMVLHDRSSTTLLFPGHLKAAGVEVEVTRIRPMPAWWCFDSVHQGAGLHVERCVSAHLCALSVVIELRRKWLCVVCKYSVLGFWNVLYADFSVLGQLHV